MLYFIKLSAEHLLERERERGWLVITKFEGLTLDLLAVRKSRFISYRLQRRACFVLCSCGKGKSIIELGFEFVGLSSKLLQIVELDL